MNRAKYYFPNIEEEYLGPFAGYYLSYLPDGRECRKYMEHKPPFLERLFARDVWVNAPNSYLPE
jgi:hypothetical protein